MQGERKRSGGHGESRVWPMDASPSSDPRTPLAWQHRNLNYQQQQQQQQATYVERLPSAGHKQHQQKDSPRHGGQGAAVYSTEEETMGGRRPSSPSTATSSTSTTSSGSHSHKNEYSNTTLPTYATNVGGVPMTSVSTWDGEPCPVHHLPAISAIIAPPPPPPQQLILSPMTTMSRRGTPCYPPSMMAGPPPPPPDKNMMLLVPPMMRPRPLVLPAQNANHLEPLPVREPKRSLSKDTDDSFAEFAIPACEGHTIVLWLIIIIITIGVILAAVLRFVMG